MIMSRVIGSRMWVIVGIVGHGIRVHAAPSESKR